MRAAAVALVLIIGAVVILWFGNTLNSWVLGGLIGGFAALLISIPISVTLFLYMSRRHDEKLRAGAEQNVSVELADLSFEDRQRDVYEADADVLDTDEDWYEDENEYISSPVRNLPVPSYTPAPVVRQSQALTNTGISMSNMRQRSTSLPSTRRPSAPLSPQRQYGPGFPRQGQKPTQQSQHLTSALHAARLEALQQQTDDEMYSPSTSKRLPVVRPDQRVGMRPPAQSQQTSRQFQSPFPQQNQNRPRRMVDGTSIPATGISGNQRSLPPGGGSLASRQAQNYGQYHEYYDEPDTGQIRDVEPQTGQLRDANPQTGPMRQQPRTGQIARNPHVEEQRGNPERVSGTLKNPMVRRAPYMYEDDPMRQEFAQHLNGPVVRRSSRKLYPEEAED
ncbi:MAG TPA: hypothetical protein VKR42_11715 [Ktedonobacteraceae bacterium]|nr:hypothetical protein [Ktedonobacteraceae bacterium]